MEHDDLIPLAAVPALIPSSRPGKKVALSTLYRKVLKGELPAVKCGRYYFVKRSDLDRLFVRVEKPTILGIESSRQAARRKRWVEGVLKRAGI